MKKFGFGKKSHQSGRSLLEMIGVLSIMGLITLAFIISYRSAIDRHHANLILSEIARMAISGSSQLVAQDDFNLNEFIGAGDDKPYIRDWYPVIIGKKYNDLDKSFSLSVTEVPYKVCTFVLAAQWKLPYETKINDGGVCDERAEGNTILFAFNDELSHEIASSGSSSGSGSGGGDPTCGGSCTAWQTCVSGSCACDPGKLPDKSYSACKATSGFLCACATGSTDADCPNITSKTCSGGKPSYNYGNS